jgi:hypothetical protein
MTQEIAKTGKRKLIFDGDGSQYTSAGLPCRLCGVHQTVDDMPPSVFIRVREKLEDGSSRLVMHVCPNCVARLFLQVERLSLWNQVSGVVMAAIKRVFEKKRAKSEAKASKGEGRPALGNIPGPKLPSRGLEKLLPKKGA